MKMLTKDRVKTGYKAAKENSRGLNSLIKRNGWMRQSFQTLTVPAT